MQRPECRYTRLNSTRLTRGRNKPSLRLPNLPLTTFKHIPFCRYLTETSLPVLSGQLLNAGYIPAVAAGRAEFSTGILVGGVIPTLYKDCLENNGYLKIGTDRVPLAWDEKLFERRPDPSCGTPDQTCLWLVPSGWGVAPLPHRSKP
jgi:hypothetical protein